ncbi:MAG: RDD family protein [Gammaproteobacteria bacterium]|nr:RDD family protein [Gammaproteobacteria bacterium]
MDNIYASPNSDVSPAESDITYSGFWIRVLAALLDSIWLLLLTFTLGWMVYGAVYFESAEFSQGTADIFISWVLPFALTIMFWHFKSATPGKMILGIKIVDANTMGKASPGKLLIRYLGYYISMIPLCLGIFWVGWDKRKQGWHDKIAGTLVIKEK